MLRRAVLHRILPATQNYFTRVLEDDIKAVIKPQYVDHIPKAVRGNVEEVLDGKDQRGIKQYLLDHLDLTQVGLRGGAGGFCVSTEGLLGHARAH
jgi:translation initiation factor RLI1